ncbi:hypothetical protein N0V90_007482 [Kalmusia sp. IMI 367209]|nr:hypothetical protein N0V90_007482 [Kalmusia sp. IMI 367209]
MGPWLLLRLLPLGFLLRPVVCENSTTAAYIETSAEYNTECKTCPHSLCPNTLYYSTSDPLNATCWTRGTRIVDTSLWLRTSSSCYVTEYDVVDAGDYTSLLPYCGPGSSDEDLTLEDATLQYKTECRICPQISCDTVAYLMEETDVELTCWTPDGQVIIDDPVWHKTTNNCYVAQKNLYSKPDITYLDNCGPIPLLEIEKHSNENGTSEVDKRAPPTSSEAETWTGPEVQEEVMAPQYLINVTVGEDYAPCRTCPQDACHVEKRLPESTV